ncbi:hypothetical protein MuYL_2695 [Mucilaginibacter xinganensis]|uniref:Uncharacterized protein n=1 Tax=Mucilaginibacter xinganensis TaxID=1234841 RepID=A0A223NXI8_9SPHI|nr:hypothetical protein MuYL_2695 [Mucilaginibacter xinganensis]
MLDGSITITVQFVKYLNLFTEVAENLYLIMFDSYENE